MEMTDYRKALRDYIASKPALSPTVKRMMRAALGEGKE